MSIRDLFDLLRYQLKMNISIVPFWYFHDLDLHKLLK